jgi:hypothetical protein
MSSPLNGYPLRLPQRHFNAAARFPFLIESPAQWAISEIMRYMETVLAARSSGSRTTEQPRFKMGSMFIGFNACPRLQNIDRLGLTL